MPNLELIVHNESSFRKRSKAAAAKSIQEMVKFLLGSTLFVNSFFESDLHFAYQLATLEHEVNEVVAVASIEPVLNPHDRDILVAEEVVDHELHLCSTS